MLDKSRVYIGFAVPYKGRNQSPSKRFKRVRILFEDDISYYVESLVDKDAQGFGKRYSVKKHAFVLRWQCQDRTPEICEHCKLHIAALALNR